MKPIRRQVIVITGASSGIGLATARRAAEAGASVLLVARNERGLSEICAGLRAEGASVDYAVADVGDEAEIEAVVAKAQARFGGFDTWVNNAGVAIYAPLVETPTAEHARMFRTNYWGVVFGSLAAVRHLRSRGGGALITVGSVASDMGSPILGAYAASKHAVKGFVDTLRIELLRDGAPISVTLVKPSGIDTPLARHAANHLDGEARIPPPLYAPDLVADAILHAAAHPTREVTIGGAGFLQTMLATHAPSLFDRVAGTIVPALSDPERPKTERHNLFEPSDAGAERLGTERAMPFSLHTAAALHPNVVAGLGLVAGLALLAAGRVILARRDRR